VHAQDVAVFLICKKEVVARKPARARRLCFAQSSYRQQESAHEILYIYETNETVSIVLEEQEGRKMSELPVIDMVKTGQNIKKLRKEMGLSVRDLQVMFGFTTPQAIYKWQHGDCMPSIDNLVVLAAIFQVHMEEIIVIDRISA